MLIVPTVWPGLPKKPWKNGPAGRCATGVELGFGWKLCPNLHRFIVAGMRTVIFLQYKRPVRQAVAAVELAICLPLMVIFTFSSIEMCSAIYLRQTLTIAAYEGARVACHPQGVTSDARNAAQRILTERRINGSSIATNPSNFDSVAKGTVIQVRVTAPVGANSLLRFGIFGNSQLTADCSMRKE